MRVAFSDEKLQYIEGSKAGDIELPVKVITAARKKIAILSAMKNKESLERWCSLDLSHLGGGEFFSALDESYKLYFSIIETEGSSIINILSIGA